MSRWRNVRSRLLIAGTAGALVVAGVAVALPAHAANAVDFFVSPTGSDSNSGTSASSPFKTLQKAQSAVRAVDQANSGAITINLAGGTYRLTSPLVFTAADSSTGTAGSIWWKAESGAAPVVSGGAAITGWTQVDPTKHIWSASVPASL